MAKERKFTDEQKYEIALDLISGKLAHAEVCRKWNISSTYAYKLKDRALELLRQGMARPAGKPDAAAPAPRPETLTPELASLVTDDVLAGLPGLADDAAQERANLDRRRPPVEDGQPHHSPREVIDHGRHPPAERPALGQGSEAPVASIRCRL